MADEKPGQGPPTSVGVEGWRTGWAGGKEAPGWFDLLTFLAERLVNVYGESPNLDYILATERATGQKVLSPGRGNVLDREVLAEEVIRRYEERVPAIVKERDDLLIKNDRLRAVTERWWRVVHAATEQVDDWHGDFVEENGVDCERPLCRSVAALRHLRWEMS